MTTTTIMKMMMTMMVMTFVKTAIVMVTKTETIWLSKASLTSISHNPKE